MPGKQSHVEVKTEREANCERWREPEVHGSPGVAEDDRQTGECRSRQQRGSSILVKYFNGNIRYPDLVLWFFNPFANLTSSLSNLLLPQSRLPLLFLSLLRCSEVQTQGGAVPGIGMVHSGRSKQCMEK